MLTPFKIGIYHFVLEAGNRRMELPSFYGSTFRGAFGMAFKRIVCANTAQSSCHDCSLESVCAYAYIFETSPPVGTERLKSYDDVPRPFMFFPKLKDKTNYAPGEKLVIELRLFGKANDYFPYFILSFIQMGERGLGYQRKSFHLKKVFCVDPFMKIEQLVFDGEKNKVYQAEHVLHGQQLMKYVPQKTKHVRVNFRTPLRIKEKGDLVTTIEFQHLARSLMRRASSMMLFHHGTNLQIDYAGLAEKSRNIKRTRDLTEWYDLERFSKRQGGKMKMGGVLGEVIYEGELGEFLPLLEFGRWAGAGKGSVLGLGQMDYVIWEN